MTPDKVVDVQALCGDAVDNVPGVPGIGVKTAAELINTYGDVETLLSRTAEIKQPKRRQALEENAELARISKKLVTLSRDVPVALPLDALVRMPLDAKQLFPFLKAMEFTTIAKRLGALLEADPEQFEADPELAAAGSKAGADRLQQRGQGRRRARRGSPPRARASNAAVLFAAERAARLKALPVDASGYETIRDAATLERWIGDAYAQGYVAVDTETTGLDNQTADLVGVALALAPGKAAYLPLGHVTGNGMFGDRVEGQIDAARGAGPAEAAAGRSFYPQDRPQHQIRSRAAAALRHRARAVRRHAADELRARRRAVQHAEPAVARTGSATPASRSPS